MFQRCTECSISEPSLLLAASFDSQHQHQHVVRRQQRHRKARLSSPVASASQDPSGVVQEALVALRKADTDRLREFTAPGWVQLGVAERRVTLVGGQPFAEEGPLACFAEIIDTGARRLLPGNLLRRCKVLSSLQVSERKFQQRVAVTACTGEEGVLDWMLEKHANSWLVASISRDHSCDFPLPESPHPRHSPEAVTLGQLSLLRAGDLAAAARFHVYATIPRGEDMSERAMASILQSDRFLPILGHVQAELGACALPTSRKFIQEVFVTPQHGQIIPRGAAVVEPRDSRSDEVLRQSFVWTLGLRDSGNWMVLTVDAVVPSL